MGFGAMKDKTFKKFVCAYHFEGCAWSFEIKARDFEEAEARLERIGLGRVDGELAFRVPGFLGWAVAPMVELLNWFRGGR